MTAQMHLSPHSSLPRAVIAGMAVGLVLVAAVADATVKVTEPSARTISVSDVIAVARVNRVLGHEPFTNKNPPSVLVTVQDVIKGATRGEVIRIVGWVRFRGADTAAHRCAALSARRELRGPFARLSDRVHRFRELRASLHESHVLRVGQHYQTRRRDE